MAMIGYDKYTFGQKVADAIQKSNNRKFWEKLKLFVEKALEEYSPHSEEER